MIKVVGSGPDWMRQAGRLCVWERGYKGIIRVYIYIYIYTYIHTYIYIYVINIVKYSQQSSGYHLGIAITETIMVSSPIDSFLLEVAHCFNGAVGEWLRFAQKRSCPIAPAPSVPVSLIVEHQNPKRLWQELQEAVGYLSHWAFLRASGLGSWCVMGWWGWCDASGEHGADGGSDGAGGSSA